MDDKKCGEAAGPAMKRFPMPDGTTMILPADAVIAKPYEPGEPLREDTELGGCWD